MIKILSVILNFHIDWKEKQVEKCTGMLKYTKFPKFVFMLTYDTLATYLVSTQGVIQSHSAYDSI